MRPESTFYLMPDKSKKDFPGIPDNPQISKRIPKVDEPSNFREDLKPHLPFMSLFGGAGFSPFGENVFGSLFDMYERRFKHRNRYRQRFGDFFTKL